MNGPDGVRDACVALLREDLPERIPLLREARNLDHARLPDVAADRISSAERVSNVLNGAKASWIEVINPRKVRMRQVDLDVRGNPVYRSTWAVRVIIWALAREWEVSIAARDNLMAACAGSLLEYPTLSRTPGDTGFLVNINTIVEEPGPPFRISDDTQGSRVNPRVWTGGALIYQMDDESTLTEASTRPPWGEAEQINVTGAVAAPGQPIETQENSG